MCGRRGFGVCGGTWIIIVRIDLILILSVTTRGNVRFCIFMHRVMSSRRTHVVILSLNPYRLSRSIRDDPK